MKEQGQVRKLGLGEELSDMLNPIAHTLSLRYQYDI